MITTFPCILPKYQCSILSPTAEKLWMPNRKMLQCATQVAFSTHHCVCEIFLLKHVVLVHLFSVHYCIPLPVYSVLKIHSYINSYSKLLLQFATPKYSFSFLYHFFLHISSRHYLRGMHHGWRSAPQGERPDGVICCLSTTLYSWQRPKLF